MKKLFIISTILSVSTAYSMCYPEIKEGTKENPCHCQFPVFDGKELKCGDDYCKAIGKECMDDGTCCYEICITDNEQCCKEGQTCHPEKGCLNPEVPIETLCQDAGGTIITSNNGSKFCYCSSSACSGNWDDINNWCERNGMAMPSIDDVCPTWTKSLGPGQCPEFVDVYPGIASAFTSTLSRDGYAYAIASIYGSVMEEDITRYVSVFCHLPPR